jgi:hypothetical protein
VNLEAARRRARWTAERTWTAERVEEAICTAWAARPRTTEHTAIMLWPTVFLSTPNGRISPQRLNDLRMAIHMMGLSCQDPSYKITYLVRHRLNIKDFGTYRDRKRLGCALIARALNDGAELPAAQQAA